MPVLRPLGPILLASALALGACDSAEDRAERHYQRAVALLQEGDTARAMVELRNVFRLDGDHSVARQTYAGLLKDRGEIREAYAQFRLLAEQDPQNAVAHREITALALQVQDLETARIHAKKAYALDPGDPMVRALKATLDFRDGTDHGADRQAAIAMAKGVLEDDPANVPAQMVVIAESLAADDTREALARVDAALAEVPGDEGLHLARLTTLEALGDTAAAGAELRDMVRLFPDNEGARAALIQWHLASGDPDGAEAVLREAAARDPGTPARKLTVVQFLYELRGPDAARAELERLVRTDPAPAPFQRALAEIDFTQGRSDAAIAALRGLLEEAAPSDATRDLQVALAAMLAETGAREEAGGLVDTVLAADPAQVDALKLRARLAIEDDRPDAAVQDMRTALGQAPRDPEIMTIMARAHERQGARELMGERLALAVEASAQAPAESLRYADYLMQEGRLGPAEGVIVDALRARPEHRELLDMLGRIHLARRDWSRADQVAGLLRGLGDPAAVAMANAIAIESLRGQGRTQEATDLLAGLAEADGAGGGDTAGDAGRDTGGDTGGDMGGDMGALAELVRTEVEAGDLEGASARLEAMLAREPGNRPARLLLAGVRATSGEAGAAESIYRELISEAPGVGQTYEALFALLASQGRTDEAESVLEAGIAASDDPGLLFTRAGLLEARGEVPGAIAVYETLYRRDTDALVVANNLASLLTTPGAAPDGDARVAARNLERAWTVARRLRGARVPQFRDTYGWLLHLRGNSEAALEHLVPAAEALPDVAEVQYHRGEAEFALGRRAAARASFARALAAAGAGSPLPQADAARARLSEIEARSGGAAAPDGG
jgi:cellulose synthase operon protein C